MRRYSLSVAAAVFALTATAWADEPACDLGVGDSVGAYKVVKAGGIEDGIKVGDKKCYM